MSTTPIREMAQKYNRQNILNTCKRLFVNKLLTDITSNQICEETGYSKRTLYIYFESKQEIYDTIVSQALIDLKLHLSEKHFNSIYDFIWCMASYRAENPIDFFYISQRKFNLSAESLSEFRKIYESFCNLLFNEYSITANQTDFALITYNTIMFAMNNDIPVSKIEDYILGGLSKH